MSKQGTLISVADNQEGANPEIVTEDRPLPVQLQESIDINEAPLTHETDIVIHLCEISKKLSILIKYEAMLHKVDLEEKL